ncbi:MAG: dihydrofolate reductase [Candidatus Marinimicrobia bacterium]|nr:dihydrofolate reductase [Candidatus Neomarinimicrobiota bacterium]
MNRKFFSISLFLAFTLLTNISCDMSSKQKNNFKVQVDRFSDIEILRYEVPGFEDLSLKQKKFIYYLSEAALSGRDIIYDQNYKYNLTVRSTLNNIVQNFNGNKSSKQWAQFIEYAKRVWFSNGIHHHYSTLKILPGFDQSYLTKLVEKIDKGFPLNDGENIDEFLKRIIPIIFDPIIDAKRVNLNPKDDIIYSSANNYYDGLSQDEVEKFYSDMKNPKDPTPIWYGLNSRLVKEKGKVVEKTWKLDGLYGDAIKQIIYWLQKAKEVAENGAQKEELEFLIDYYRTGDLKTWDKYNIAWVGNTEIDIDYINGFIEVYGDPKGIKASYESLVEINDFEATERMKTLSENAQWFEDNAPIMDKHKRDKVKGITYNVVNVAMLGGDVSPSSPIGINLPNSNWIRANYGSKSVSLGNITAAYDQARSGGFVNEFALTDEEKNRAKKYGSFAGKMHTAMHEVLGHASGKLEKDVGTPKETLKSYASTLEEGRADLFGLYYIMDPKLVEMNLVKSDEVGKSEYDGYIRNGLMLQLRRLKRGEKIEQSHMRNRAYISRWVFEKGQPDNVIEKKIIKGKTFFTINDYQALRELFGLLLKEVQRIKSQGDYKAAKDLVEGYGIDVDASLHEEVLNRSESLNVAPYAGFMNPKLDLVIDKDGSITDVKISYPDDFLDQMLHYDKTYSFLPLINN